jgi:hypothetical protein
MTVSVTARGLRATSHDDTDCALAERIVTCGQRRHSGESGGRRLRAPTPWTASPAGSEFLNGGAQHDFVDVDVGRLGDGEGNSRA